MTDSLSILDIGQLAAALSPGLSARAALGEMAPEQAAAFARTAFGEQMVRDALGLNVQKPVRLSDGSTGWPVRHAADCWPAAVACAVQVPLEQLPDLELDARLRAGMSPAEVDCMARQEMDEWLTDSELKAVRHAKAPIDSARWVGVIPIGGARPFMSHCLVLNRANELLFDPSQSVAGVLGRQPRSWTPKHVRFGYTFEPVTPDEDKGE